jgi:hypothetical protein
MNSLVTAKDIPGIGAVFDYAKLLMTGQALVATSGAATHYFGYESNLILKRSAGVMLLDATADIDGISSIVPWRVETETPKATYGRLEIVHVPPHHKGNLARYLKTAENSEPTRSTSKIPSSIT